MVVRKIEFWARIGQISFFVYMFATAKYSAMYQPLETLEANAENIAMKSAVVALLASIIFSEAIVRLIGYFAELIARKNVDSESFEEKSKRIRNTKLP